MKLNILLLCNKPSKNGDANTIIDHIESIASYSKNHIWLYSNIGDFARKLDLNRFDVIIIHYSLCLLNNYYISKKAKNKLRDFSGLKVVFIQDEYRQINKIIEELNFLKIDILFTCFPPPEIPQIYPEASLPGVAKYHNLTGYVPERLIRITNQPLMHNRKTHVGYRGRKLPFWYGELGFEKWDIVEKWMLYTAESGLTVDLSYKEQDRIYGEDWIDFIQSCKTMLGVESGASIMDFTGDLEKKICSYQQLHPNESFYQVQKKFLLEYEGKHKLNQISPRCFEAIALKTVLVLYEGEYSGILIPNRHYIMLKKDFSNIQEVLNLIGNDTYLQSMADTAYREIALNPKYSYQFFVKNLDKIIHNEFKMRSKQQIHSPYTMKKFKNHTKLSFKKIFHKYKLIILLKYPKSILLLAKRILLLSQR